MHIPGEVFGYHHFPTVVKGRRRTDNGIVFDKVEIRFPGKGKLGINKVILGWKRRRKSS